MFSPTLRSVSADKATPGPALSVVIPCCNEIECLEECYARISAAAHSVARSDYEIIFVNDGSTDATWPRLVTLAKSDAHIVALNLSRNHGHQLALTAGLDYARGARVFVIDADLQDPPELLPAMWARLDAGVDVVYGQRKTRDGENWFKKATATFFYRLTNWLSEIEIPVDVGDFRLMSRAVVDVLLAMPEAHRFIRGMVCWTGFTQEPLPYDRAARFAGTTKYPIRKMLKLAIDGITAFSTAPLRLSFWLAFAFIGLSLILTAYILISVFDGNAIPGWASSILVPVVFGGAQLFCLAILGEYVGRIYVQSKQRPLFIVKEIVKAPSKEPQK